MKYVKYTTTCGGESFLDCKSHLKVFTAYDAVKHFDVDSEDPDHPNLICHLFSGVYMQLEGSDILNYFLEKFENTNIDVIDMTKETISFDENNSFECWTSFGENIASY